MALYDIPPDNDKTLCFIKSEFFGNTKLGFVSPLISIVHSEFAGRIAFDTLREMTISFDPDIVSSIPNVDATHVDVVSGVPAKFRIEIIISSPIAKARLYENMYVAVTLVASGTVLSNDMESDDIKPGTCTIESSPNVSGNFIFTYFPSSSNKVGTVNLILELTISAADCVFDNERSFEGAAPLSARPAARRIRRARRAPACPRRAE